MTLLGSSCTERPLSVVPSSLWQWPLVRLFKTHLHSKDGTQEHSELEEPGIHSFKSEGKNTGVEELQGGMAVKLSSRWRCMRALQEADCWLRSSMVGGAQSEPQWFQWEGAMNRMGQEAGHLALQQFPHLQTCTTEAWKEDAPHLLHLTLEIPPMIRAADDRHTRGR